MGRPDLAIVIPAYNEAATIGNIVAQASAYGRVIVVDDCSTDTTAEAAGLAGAVVVSNDTNKGYDGTLETGFAKATELGVRAVVTMDADGEHDPACLADFSTALLEENIPLVLGIRAKKQRLAEVIMGFYFHARYEVRDIMCGMKGYHLSLYDENDGFDHVRSVGSELALNSIRRGHKFCQIPVTGKARVDAPRFGNILKANFRIFQALWRGTFMRAGAK